MSDTNDPDQKFDTPIPRRVRSQPSRSAGAIVAFAIGSVILLVLTIVAIQAVFQQDLERSGI